MFTVSQIEEIKKKILADFSVKDTEFQKASNVSGNDMVAIVQGGENKVVPIKMFSDAVSIQAASNEEIESIIDNLK